MALLQENGALRNRDLSSKIAARVA